MKLIKNLDMRQEKTGENTNKWALFLCPYCNKEVERRKSGGLRNKSCGCVHRKLSAEANIKHGDGMLTSKYRKLYHTWVLMKRRCNNPIDEGYKNYGGRGIKVCKQWQEYISFKEWALLHGYKENLTIDREDNNGNYEPSNCRWVTQAVNNRNKNTTKLNWLTVHLIRALRDNGCERKELFKMFNIKPATLNNVFYDNRWIEIDNYVSFNNLTITSSKELDFLKNICNKLPKLNTEK